MYNGHADVTALINATGAVLATYYYDEFGTQTETTGTMDNPYRYAGYVYDGETELYYLNARYYDSKIARFLQEDTFSGYADDPLSLNLYSYCVNNPISYTDSTGHDCYIDDNGKVHITGIVISNDADVYLNPNYIFDDITVQNGSTVTISGLHNAGNITTSAYSNTTIDNSGNIDSITTGANSTTNINNLSSGTIGIINTGEDSITAIDNYGIIDVINTGSDSTTNIVNNGLIGIVNTGTKSTNTITNNFYIGLINTGLGNHTAIEDGGFIGWKGGNGTIEYFSQRTDFPNVIKNADGSTTINISSDTIKILEDINLFLLITTDPIEKERLEKLKEDVVIKDLQGTPYVFANDKIDNMLKQNGEVAQDYNKNHNIFQNLKFFVNQVKGGGDWDIKEKSEWQLPYDTFNGEEVNKNSNEQNTTPFLYYNGQLLSGSDLGNINYGYTGTALDIPSTILFVGAGMYNVIQNFGTSNMDPKWVFGSSMGDDPKDMDFTAYGIAKYQYDNK